tara:strand:+ start:80 stop:262 length:183 start_codon:yes stop_codon:yes gene_type:complete
MITLTDDEYDYFKSLEFYARQISLNINVESSKKLMNKKILKKLKEEKKFLDNVELYKDFI